MSYTVRLLLCLFLATSVWGRSREKEAQQALWRADLRSFGYTGFVPQVEQWDIRLRAWPICFVDNSSVVATFVTREESRTLGTRHDPQSPSPLKLHAVVLDNSTGKPKAVREWPAQRPRAWVFPVAGSKFIVVTTDKLVLLGSDLETLKEFSFPIGAGTNVDMWHVFTSPTGRSILYEFSDPEGFHCFWIDAQQLEVLRSWTDADKEALGWWISISDRSIAKPHEFHSPPYGSELLIRELDGRWRSVCRDRLGCGSPIFINDSTLLLTSSNEMRLVRTTGEVLFRQSVPQGTTFFPYFSTAVAAERGRFAVLLFREKGGVPLLDIMPDFMFDQAMVHDMTLRQWVFTLHAKKAKIRKFSGLALSPDGTRMAVLADGVLQVFAVGDGPP